MSIIKKPYEISVWDDIWDGDKGKFVEKRICVIGSDKMESQSRAIQPNFTRNTNGTKKFSFKMYKKYIDTTTGEKVTNPFSEYLISERKVKLKYKGEWHDFIVKNIVEDNSTYLYTYQLEDALVNELSKNGFGVILDEKKMNNMGTANKLAATVLDETDWTVSKDSEAFVQTVDEALVYLVTTEDIYPKHILDQTDLKLGVTEEVDYLKKDSTVLAFYSSCANKPHRFQFIFKRDLTNLAKDKDRNIVEKDCQYYIDFDDPKISYQEKDSTYGFYIPKGFKLKRVSEDGVESVLSSKYRGKRYGFAQQAEYIPVLDRYVNIYESEEMYSPNVGFGINNAVAYQPALGMWTLGMQGAHGGLGLDYKKLGLENGKSYKFSYKFTVTDTIQNVIYTIGGHATDYEFSNLKLYRVSSNSLEEVGYEGNYTDGISLIEGDGTFAQGQGYVLEATIKFTYKENNPQHDLYIQPNKWRSNTPTNTTIVINSISVKELSDDQIVPHKYYGYENVKYQSSALMQNIISNTSFESASGWTGTRSEEAESKAIVENVYGYFSNSTFISSIDDLNNGTFDPEKGYKAYLKITFPGGKGCVINSGPFDNRTLIGKFEDKEKWALTYKALNLAGEETTGLVFDIGEYKYSPRLDGYEKDETNLRFSSFASGDDKNSYYLTEVERCSYNEKDFKKKMQCRLGIKAYYGTIFYIEDIALFKAVFDENNSLILPEAQASNIDDRVLDKTYYFFSPSALDGISDTEEFKPDETLKELTYTKYKPVYNEGAQKVRSVTAKESNYFNILQSIAETFGAWLKLKITRNSSGGIDKKEVEFKNYSGQNNHAGFKYGVNLKGIQRTFESKNIVTKLIVKQNSNEHAENGFCTIARAGANPTGENYIYDFQYYHNKGLLNATDYLNTVYVLDKEKAKGKDQKIEHTETNLVGYFPRIKKLNSDIQEKSETLINIAQDLTRYKANLETAEAGLEAALSGIEQSREDFELLTGISINNISKDKISGVTATETIYTGEEEEQAKNNLGIYLSEEPDYLQTITVTATQPNGYTFYVYYRAQSKEAMTSERTLRGIVYYKITFQDGTTTTQSANLELKFAKGAKSSEQLITVSPVDSTRSDVKRLQNEYTVYVSKEDKFRKEKEAAQNNVNDTQASYDELEENINTLTGYKKALNQLFFTNYSRFIQEGTWISEEYVDDEKYYADAQSVMYNSCYPQVAYSINTLELSSLPGYEAFTFEPGDKTFVEDYDFFGDDHKEEVIVTELSENLDDPSNNQIRVQNFKNQFQDLFQKITASVQQAQYSTGSYEKAVALAEANQARKQEFFTDALNSATARLSAAGQQSVVQGADGLTIYDTTKPCDAIRMIGGAILLSKQDENGQQKWVTGVTSDGISASLITAGMINAGEISIMNADEPVFRWDAYGISAYDAEWYDSGIGTTISGVDTTKFVRFDKYGIYGINSEVLTEAIDGGSWHPADMEEIDSKATFALTWDGLKVTQSLGGNKFATARIGNYVDENKNKSIIKVNNGEKDTLLVDATGKITIDGIINATGGSNIAGWQTSDNFFGKITNVVAAEEDYYDYESRIKDATYYLGTCLSAKPEDYTNGHNVFAIGALKKGSSNELEGSWAQANFRVNARGKLFAKNAEISGKITANDGEIGGWKISDNFLITEGEYNGVAKKAGLSKYGAGPAFWAGATDTDYDNSPFKVMHDGRLFATAANIQGKITANGGSNIAGWETTSGIFGKISDHKATEAEHFFDGIIPSEDYYFGSCLSAKTIDFEKDYNVFAIGALQKGSSNSLDGSWGKANFRVTGHGRLFAKNAKIAGEIIAESGYIGNFLLDSGTLRSDAYELEETIGRKLGFRTPKSTHLLEDAALAIGYRDGYAWTDAPFHVTFDGIMNAAGGSIGSCQFGKEQYPIKNLDIINPERITISYKNTIIAPEPVITYQVKRTPSSSLKAETFNHYNLTKGGDYSSNTNDLSRYYALGWSSEPGVPPTGTEFVTFSALDTSVIKDKPHLWIQMTLRKRNSDVDFCVATYYIGNYASYGTTLSFGNNFCIGKGILTNGKHSIEFASNGCTLSGTWYYKSGEINSSWRGAKNSIEELDDRYSILFDELKPVRFKYNDGQSQRYHTGFILDELKTAMDSAKIDTSEFAAYCVADSTTGEGGIRYGELISLNIHQIQKLKPRMSSAEQEILALKQEVSLLKEEIATLKQI